VHIINQCGRGPHNTTWWTALRQRPAGWNPWYIASRMRRRTSCVSGTRNANNILVGKCRRKNFLRDLVVDGSVTWDIILEKTGCKVVEDFVHLVKGMFQWWACASKIMNLWVSLKCSRRIFISVKSVYFVSCVHLFWSSRWASYEMRVWHGVSQVNVLTSECLFRKYFPVK
jgi:hypothetical protein